MYPSGTEDTDKAGREANKSHSSGTVDTLQDFPDKAESQNKWQDIKVKEAQLQQVKTRLSVIHHSEDPPKGAERLLLDRLTALEDKLKLQIQELRLA